MASKVQIIIEEVLKGSGVSDAVVKDLNNIDKASKTTTQNFKLSWTDALSALTLAEKALDAGVEVWKQTGAESLKYADQVRSLSLISGQGAEDTSRFIQVLDDYKISAQDAETATRALTKNGHAPSLDTLAKLSDQYLKLTSDEEKNKFVIDNLGRAGLQWVEVLNKGSDAIRKQGAAVSDGLILNQKQLDDARRLEVQMDNLNDSVEALKITFGNKLVPVLHDVIAGWRSGIEAVQLMREKHISFAEALRITHQGIVDEDNAMVEAANSADNLGQSTDDLAAKQEAAATTAKTLSTVYTGLLSTMFSIQKSNDAYNNTLEDIAKKDEDLTAKKQQLTLQMWEEQRAGKLTNEENLKYVQQLAEITKAQEDNQAAKAKAEEDNKNASKQRIYDLAQQKLAADGVIDSGEYDYLQNLAVSYGLVSRAAADQAIAENKRADALVASFEQTLPPMQQSLQVMQNLAALSGTVVDFRINFQQNSLPNVPTVTGKGTTPKVYTPISYTTAGGSKAVSRGLSRDSGGSGSAGTPYYIGTGAQPELFIPSTSGTFVPNGKSGMGTTYKIVVNNPKKEETENSVRTALKKLSYLGVAA